MYIYKNMYAFLYVYKRHLSKQCTDRHPESVNMLFPKIGSSFSFTKSIDLISIFLYSVSYFISFYISGHYWLIYPVFTLLLLLPVYIHVKAHGFWEKIAPSSAKGWAYVSPNQ